MHFKFRGLAVALMVMSLIMFAKTAQAADDYEQYDMLDDAGVYALVQDVDHHFSEAKDDFENHKYKAAANDIRNSTIFLKLAASRGIGNEKKAVQDSVGDLMKLADKVENGTVKSRKTLDDAFAHAQLALAMNSWIKASEAWNKKDYEAVDRALEASRKHLKHAKKWAGHNKKKQANKKRKSDQSQ